MHSILDWVTVTYLLPPRPSAGAVIFFFVVTVIPVLVRFEGVVFTLQVAVFVFQISDFRFQVLIFFPQEFYVRILVVVDYLRRLPVFVVL